jgi:hypothetical protein
MPITATSTRVIEDVSVQKIEIRLEEIFDVSTRVQDSVFLNNLGPDRTALFRS